MKKLVILGALFVILCASGQAYALSGNDTLPVNVDVNTVFTFSIGEPSLTLPPVSPGQTTTGSCTMYCVTNHNMPWTIKVRTSGALTSGINTIPLANFKFNTFAPPTSPGTGTYVTTDTALTTVDQIAYTAATAEKNTADTRVSMMFVVSPPSTTPSGTYGATITATMTE